MFRIIFILVYFFISSLYSEAWPPSSNCYSYNPATSIVTSYSYDEPYAYVPESKIGAPNKLECVPLSDVNHGGDLVGYYPHSCYSDGNPPSGYSDPLGDGYRLCRYRSFFRVVSQCSSGQVVINNQCVYAPTCNTPLLYNGYLHMCQKNPCSYYKRPSPVTGECTYTTSGELAEYNNDDKGCYAHGGVPSWKGIGVYKFGIEKKCQTFTEAEETGGKVAMALGLIGPPPAMKSLGSLLKQGALKLKDFIDGFLAPNSTVHPSDMHIGMPKITSPSSPATADFVATPIPKDSDGLPTRGSTIDMNPANTFLREPFFPIDTTVNPTANQTFSQAELGRFNRTNDIYHSNNVDPGSYPSSSSANVFESVSHREPTYNGTSALAESAVIYKTVPVRPSQHVNDFFDIVPPANNLIEIRPPKISDNPIDTTYVHKVQRDGIEVDEWTHNIHYGDGSQLKEVIRVNEALKRGSRSSTVLEPDGSTSVVSEIFNLPNYKPQNVNSPDNWKVEQTSPFHTSELPINRTSTGFDTVNPVDPSTGFPSEPNSNIDPSTGLPYPGTNNLPQTQNVSELINAPMPSYSFFEDSLFESMPIDTLNDLNSNITGLINGLVEHVSNVNTVFENTKTMISQGWNPPQIQAGSCGSFMSFSFHGSSINLCEPMSNFASNYAPLFSFLITLSGMIASVRIFFGGFNT